MARVAGNHLEKTIELQKKIDSYEQGAGAEGGSGSAAQAKEFIENTAKMQAHTQMFKAMNEALTTIVKSVGEAISSTLRKQ